MGNVNIIKFLLAAGAQPNWASKAMTGDVEGAKAFLIANPEVLNKLDKVM